MTIVIKTSKYIVALHEGVVYFFSVEALDGGCAIPKQVNTRANLGRRVVGFSIDPDDFRRWEVFAGDQLARMLLYEYTHEYHSEDSVLISQKRLNELEARDTELSRLEASGVNNWEGY